MGTEIQGFLKWFNVFICFSIYLFKYIYLILSFLKRHVWMEPLYSKVYASVCGSKITATIFVSNLSILVMQCKNNFPCHSSVARKAAICFVIFIRLPVEKSPIRSRCRCLMLSCLKCLRELILERLQSESCRNCLLFTIWLRLTNRAEPGR